MLEGAKSMGAGAATIASAGAAVGIGNVFSSLIHSVARNPSLAKQLEEGMDLLIEVLCFSSFFMSCRRLSPCARNKVVDGLGNSSQTKPRLEGN